MATGTGGRAWIWGGPFHPDKHIPAGPAIKDIDGDGEPEIIVLARNRCICLEHDLTEKWVVSELSTPSSDHTAWGVAIADIDGDTYDEVIFSGGHQDGVVGFQGGLFVVSRTGTVLSFLALNTAGQVTTLPTIFDIDGDGALEVIVCDDNGKVYCCRWDSGALTLVWSRDVSGSALTASPCLLDINGDGLREILVAPKGGTILALSGVDGSTVATFEHGYSGSIVGTLTGGDIDGDGNLELLIPFVEAGRLLCFRLGANAAGNWFRRWGFSSTRAGEVSDVDGG